MLPQKVIRRDEVWGEVKFHTARACDMALVAGLGAVALMRELICTALYFAEWLVFWCYT